MGTILGDVGLAVLAVVVGIPVLALAVRCVIVVWQDIVIEPIADQYYAWKIRRRRKKKYGTQNK